MDKVFILLVSFVISVLAFSVMGFKKHSAANTLNAAEVILGHGRTIKQQRQPAIDKRRVYENIKQRNR